MIDKLKDFFTKRKISTDQHNKEIEKLVTKYDYLISVIRANNTTEKEKLIADFENKIDSLTSRYATAIRKSRSRFSDLLTNQQIENDIQRKKEIEYERNRADAIMSEYGKLNEIEIRKLSRLYGRTVESYEIIEEAKNAKSVYTNLVEQIKFAMAGGVNADRVLREAEKKVGFPETNKPQGMSIQKH